jgi:hypothetical protein
MKTKHTRFDRINRAYNWQDQQDRQTGLVLINRTDGISLDQQDRQDKRVHRQDYTERTRRTYGFIEDQQDRRDCTGHKGQSELYRIKRTNGIIQKKEDRQMSTGPKVQKGFYRTPFHLNLSVF